MTESADAMNGHADTVLDARQPARPDQAETSFPDQAETSFDDQDMSGEGASSDALAGDGADEDLTEDGADEMSADALDESNHFEAAAELAADEGLEQGLGEGLDQGMDEGQHEEEEMDEGLAENLDVGLDEGLDASDLLDGIHDGAGANLADLIEATVADSLDAEDGDEFFRALLGGIGRLAGQLGRGAGTGVGGRVARPARGVAGGGGTAARQVTSRAARAARPARSVRQQLLPLLRQYAAEGTSEQAAFIELADLFSEDGVDEALPVLAGIAARRLAAPLSKRAVGPLARQLVRSTTQAARTLVRSQGRRAVRALPRLASGVARRAVRRRDAARALPRAMTIAAAQVARRPAMLRRLAGATATGGGMATPAGGSSVGARAGALRFRLQGPVEIVIYQRQAGSRQQQNNVFRGGNHERPIG